MQQLIETMKRIAHQVMSTRAQHRWGIVQSVDPAGPFVRVLLQPDGVLTGWLPVLQPSAGAGVTAAALPMPGAQAYISPDLGEAEHGVVLGFSHNDGARLPAVPNATGSGGVRNGATAPAVAGEVVFRAFGSVVRMCANGDLLLIPASGTVRIDGSLVANGDVSDWHGSLDRLRGHHNGHVHGNVVVGGGQTSAPTSPGIDAE